MKTLIAIALSIFFSTSAFAQETQILIQENLPYWSASLGMTHQPLPTEGAELNLPNVAFAYNYVDGDTLQSFRLNLILNQDNHIIAPGYAIGFSDQLGYWHIGWVLNLGYARLLDVNEDFVHGLFYRTGPMVDFSLPRWISTTYRFHAIIGVSGLLVHSGEYHQPDGRRRSLEGVTFELGVSRAM